MTNAPRAQSEKASVQKWLLYQLAHQLDPGYCARLNEILDVLESQAAEIARLNGLVLAAKEPWSKEAVRLIDNTRAEQLTAEAELVASRAENARLASFAEEAMTSRRNVAHLLAENVALAKQLDAAYAECDAMYAASVVEPLLAQNAKRAVVAAELSGDHQDDDTFDAGVRYALFILGFEKEAIEANDASKALRAGQQKGTEG